ncbi:hypothetical protein GRF29_161g864972 [Pseudopithomyces chartarum]|uniref:Uncharacterized protein n=1 Tax=Pseudopithomyces chartarum TaxID=1892770 RepID=A0AAN6RDA4_9PLEO|nr:hypothetical protein GRF29_161g864972 [Pseudopithomyces chartarum]
MPPKKTKSAAGPSSEESDDKPFHWSPENDRKLLLFMIGTTSFSGEDTERLAQHAFQGTTASAVKQRANKIRVEHRTLYEKYGWTAPDGKPAAKASSTPKGRKRAANTKDVDEDNAQASPTKKSKVGKAAESKGDDGPGNDLDGGIKNEDFEV